MTLTIFLNIPGLGIVHRALNPLIRDYGTIRAAS